MIQTELQSLKKNNSLSVQIFCNLQYHPTFLSSEMLVNLVRRRECFDGLAILLVYKFEVNTPVNRVPCSLVIKNNYLQYDEILLSLEKKKGEAKKDEEILRKY